MNPTNQSALVCTETGQTIEGEFFVAVRSNDPNRYRVLSKKIVEGIPFERRGTDRRNFALGGFDIHRGIIGENGQVDYRIESEGRGRKSTFFFSVSGVVAMELLPNTHLCFPCKVAPCLGEDRTQPVGMDAVLIT